MVLTTDLLELIVFSALLALAFTPLGIRLFRGVGLIDVPHTAPHKRHKESVPLGGGTIIFLCVLVVLWIRSPQLPSTIWRFIPAVGVVYLFGLLDDLVGFHALWKFVGQLAAGVILIAYGVYVQLFHAVWANYALTLFWLVGITNAFNFLDGSDGMVLTIGGVTSGLLALVTLGSGQMELAALSTILFGVLLGMSVYNLPPAKIFLGDQGSQMIGLLLSSLALAYNPVGYSNLASWYVPILFFFVPIFDTSLVVVSRLRRKAPLFKGGLDHSYHRLMRLPLSPRRAILIMAGAVLLADVLALALLGLPPVAGNAAFLAVVLLAAATIFWIDRNYAAEPGIHAGSGVN